MAEQAPAKERADQPVTRPDMPVPVLAWVTARQTGDFEAIGEAVGWTRRQVLVRYTDPHGRVGLAWLWASAVTSR